MLVILPIAAFLTIFIFLRSLRPVYDWRRTFLITAILWGTYLVLATELLSIFHAIFQVTLLIAWLLPILVIGIVIIKRRNAGIWLPLYHPSFSKNPLDWLLLAGLVFVVVTTALIAWLAPPQTWD